MEVLFAALIGAAVLWAFNEWAKASVARRESEIAQQDRDRQQLAIALVDGGDDRLWRLQLHDPVLRNLQIIGESISLVLNTKNDGTRQSRIGVIEKSITHLDEDAWLGLDDATRAYVLDAVDRARDGGEVKSAADVATKHIRASDRATRPETKRKYLALALDELVHVRNKRISDEWKGRIISAIGDIEDAIKTIDSEVVARTATKPATKACPFCAEDVRVEAIKCKHCGSALVNP